MDWFDNLLEKTKDASLGEWKIYFSLDGEPGVNCSNDSNSRTAYSEFYGSDYAVNNANAKLFAAGIKMRDEIIRLRNIIRASEQINTHQSLDEK